ncbi:MAG: hypothetical protein ABW137_32985 [Mycobacterium sp.]
MTIDDKSDRDENDSHDETAGGGLDPRATDHPTGSQQAAENEATDPPG